MTIMQKAHVAVDVAGELVTLKILGLDFAFEFPLALRMAAALRIEARYAKLVANDASRTIRMHGRLHNATPERIVPSRWRAKIPAVLKAHDVEVFQRGSTVVWRVGPHTMTMPYESCFSVAQWLTTAGRAARRAAGEKSDAMEVSDMRAALARERTLN